MSRKDIFKVCLVLAATASATPAFATAITGATVIGGGTFSPSNKVTIDAASDGVAYAARSGHSSGDRQVFTNNSDPKLYWSSKTIGSAPDTTSNATETVSGWTTL